MIEFSTFFKSRQNQNIVLFFFIIEKTRSFAALVCRIVKTLRATELNVGNLSIRYAKTMSIQK